MFMKIVHVLETQLGIRIANKTSTETISQSNSSLPLEIVSQPLTAHIGLDGQISRQLVRLAC